jgi:4-hydroxythreonine-4-phosphate dehydrogenase
MTDVPKIAFVMGDAAGVGIELAARLLGEECEIAKAAVLAIGDAGLLRRGAEEAGVDIDPPVVTEPTDAALEPGRPELLDLGHEGAGGIPPGVPTPESGAFAMRNFGAALDLAKAGAVDAICFTPFNKQALKLAGNPYLDEIHWAADRLGFGGRCSEYNLLDGLWNCRVTSHIPMAQVASALTRAAIVESILDADRTIRRAGTARPRIAVAGLNPHAGEGGLFGREEIEIIKPAIEAAAAGGIAVSGPFGADTMFHMPNVDAFVVMLHDQGHIAAKLLAQNATSALSIGSPILFASVAHGTGHDIVGKGIADPTAMIEALLRLSKAKRSKT